jgi:serpin B
VRRSNLSGVMARSLVPEGLFQPRRTVQYTVCPMRQRLLQSIVLVAIVSTGCDGPGEEGRSSLSRLTVAAPGEHVADTVRGLNDFALSLQRRIAEPSQNFASAPISISTALAMTSAGANGATLEGFNQALRVKRPKTEFHGALNTVDRMLASRGLDATGFDGKPFALKLTNQLFTQKGFPLERPFLDLLAQQYGAGVELLDFETQPEESRQAINAFIGERTSNLIPELIPSGSIKEETRFVLANAVYFNAAWAQRFEARRTIGAPFSLSSGAVVEVPMMSSELVSVRVADLDGVVALELPYETGEIAMLVLMPAPGQLEAVEQSLSAARLEAFVAALRPDSVRLTMPKFKVKTPTNLNEALKDEGLEQAFDPHRADFASVSRLARIDKLHLTDVVHEAVITVSEGGTEAAGATASVGSRYLSLPRTIDIDRPFVFMVRDRATGAVLFLGHVVDPR